MNFRFYVTTILIFCLCMSCNAPKKAETSSNEITVATLDSVMAHYLEKMDTGENMLATTKEEFEVLNELEERILFQLKKCLESDELREFEEAELQWEKDWKRKQDSINETNADVIFEDEPEYKEMFLTWQYTYIKELRIIDLLEFRDAYCN